MNLRDIEKPGKSDNQPALGIGQAKANQAAARKTKRLVLKTRLPTCLGKLRDIEKPENQIANLREERVRQVKENQAAESSANANSPMLAGKLGQIWKLGVTARTGASSVGYGVSADLSRALAILRCWPEGIQAIWGVSGYEPINIS